MIALLTFNPEFYPSQLFKKVMNLMKYKLGVSEVATLVWLPNLYYLDYSSESCKMRPQKIRITTFSTRPLSKNLTNPKSDIIQITPPHFPKKNFHSSVLTKIQKVHIKL